MLSWQDSHVHGALTKTKHTQSKRSRSVESTVLEIMTSSRCCDQCLKQYILPCENDSNLHDMENIIKQGYLKKAKPIAADSPRSNICSSFLQLFESSRWYIFIIRNGQPFLEIFEKEQNAFSGQPISSFNLSTCFKITYTLGRTSKIWTFCIFLEDKILELTADSRDQMLDWCRNLERTLVHYGKIKQNTEHVYVEYPVRYTPKKTGLEQERAMQASASATAARHTPDLPPAPCPDNPTDEEYHDFIHLIDHIDDDDDDYNNTDETNLKLEYLSGELEGAQSQVSDTSAKSKGNTPQGAEGGTPTVAPVDSDIDTSEDDFVSKDFWLTHKLPSVPRRSDSHNFSNSARPFSESVMTSSVPPVPIRVHSLVEKRPTFISSTAVSLDDEPKAPPRKKRINGGFQENELKKSTLKCLSEDNVSVRAPLITSNADDVEDFDDGYDNVVELKKSNSDSAASDPWVRSLENETNSKRSTLKAYDTELFVNLPPAKHDINGEHTSPDTPTPDSGSSGGMSMFKKYSGDAIYENYTSENTEGDSLTESVKQMTLGAKDENYNLCDKKTHAQGVFDGDTAGNIYDFGRSYAIKESTIVKAENIYDFARSESTLVHTHVPVTSQPSLPKRSNSSVHPPAFSASGPTEFDEFDSLYSIPKSAKPVAGLSTEEVLRPVRPPRKTTPDPAASLYAVPQKNKSQNSSSMSDIDSSGSSSIIPSKKTSKSHSSSSMEESFESSKSTVTPKTKSMDSFLAPKPPSLDTLPSQKPPSFEKLSSPPSLSLDTSSSQKSSTITAPTRRSPIAMRPLPSLPNDTENSKESQKNKLSSSTKSERPTSPSHDGFTFNFVPDAVESKSKSSTASSSGSGASKEEEPDPVYEDATGRNINPPLPPKRSTRRSENRSVSVYIPGRSTGTLTTILNNSAKKSEDDEVLTRPRVARQQSLTERQQIRQSSTSMVVIPLKQSQVELLCSEQKQHGVELDINYKSAHAIALVECFNGIWIAGWDGRRFPRLAEKIHIGDQLLSVEDLRVTGASQANKLLKQTRSERVAFVVKRLPYAQVLAIRRNQDRESLGIKRDGGTAEITYVDPNGLVARSGLPKRAKLVEGNGECNWMLTEINSRSLNFSYKGEEIERLLNAVGRDISIVAQPLDFVKGIKKQLKKLRNYKDYLY